MLKRPHNEAALRMWLSVRLSLETPQRFGLYYGVSNNKRRKWDIENAHRELGYNPVDDSKVFAAAIL